MEKEDNSKEYNKLNKRWLIVCGICGILSFISGFMLGTVYGISL